MLRITTNNGSDVTHFIVEGKLAGPCVCELEKCWQSMISQDSSSGVVVDLTSVTFVDESGKALLSRMSEEGTRFVATLLMPKAIIKEIESKQSKLTGG